MGNSHKGKFVTSDGEVQAVVENGYPLSLIGTSTLQQLEQMLTHETKCTSCRDYWSQLCAMHSRLTHKATSAHKYANNRFTPQKADKVKTLKSRVKSAERKTKEKIQEPSEASGVHLDKALHRDLMTWSKKFPRRVFQMFVLDWADESSSSEGCKTNAMAPNHD